MGNINSLKAKVEYILTRYPETRNSDIALSIRLWKSYYHKDLIEQNGKSYIDLNKLFDLPREDNIKRIRAKIQNEEKRLLPTDISVVRQRKMNELEWKQLLGY